MTMVSPDWPCPKCKSIFWNIHDDGRSCQSCSHFEKETPLEDIVPGITADIIRARREEEDGQYEEDYCDDDDTGDEGEEGEN